MNWMYLMNKDRILEDKVFKLQIKSDTWHIYLIPEDDNTIVDEEI